MVCCSWSPSLSPSLISISKNKLKISYKYPCDKNNLNKTAEENICVYKPAWTVVLADCRSRSVPRQFHVVHIPLKNYHCYHPWLEMYYSRNVQLIVWSVSVYMDRNRDDKFRSVKFPVAMSLRSTERSYSLPFCASVLKPNFHLNFTEF